MDFEFAGEETRTTGKKCWKGLGDVDIDSHAQDVVTEDTTEKHADEEAQTQTGDQQWHRRRMPVWSRRRT